MKFLFSLLFASALFFPSVTFAAKGVCVVQNAQKYVGDALVTSLSATPCDAVQDCEKMQTTLCAQDANKKAPVCVTPPTMVCQPNATPGPGVTTPSIGGSSVGKYGYRDPLGGLNLPTLIGGAIRTVLGIVGALFLLMFLYGGFLWMTAGGEGKRVEKSKETLKNAVFGMLIIMLSYTLVNLVLNFAATVPK